MKRFYIFILFSFWLAFIQAQTTAIPDTNFEQALIDLGIDSDGVINGKVSNNDISNIKSLNINSKEIQDLTGIEGFINLEYLYCYFNELTQLDLSSNLFLKSLSCELNYNLRSLNISNNSHLTYLNCSESQLKFIDLAGKTELETLICYSSKLRSLELGKSSKLKYLNCSNNELEYLNVKNENNEILTEFTAIENPNLTCISVDNATQANDHTAAGDRGIYKDWEVDSIVIYSTNCDAPITNIPDAGFEKILVEKGIDSDGVINGNVLTSDLEKITGIYISYDFYGNKTFSAAITTQENPDINYSSQDINDIASLEGIEVMVNLEVINCYYLNNVTSINVSNNILLKRLSLINSAISELDLTNNISLENLNLELSKIDKINLSNNTDLINLDFSFSTINFLDLSNNSKLESLNLEFATELTGLILSNGNNDVLHNVELTTTSSLGCIQVDNVDVANANLPPYSKWRNKESITIYSKDCFPNVPDTSFEQALIDIGIDSDTTPNGKIALVDIINVTILDISSKGINDLSSIEYFENLESFNASDNLMDSLDLSNNTKLTSLTIVNSNKLEFLDLKNGNNEVLLSVDITNSPNLKCIQVVNATAANNEEAPYNTWLKDVGVVFSEDCKSTLSIEDEILNTAVSIFPNPVDDLLNIKSNSIQLTKVEFYSVLGKKVKEITNNFAEIDVSNLSNGLYLIKINSEKGTTHRKIIKN